MRVPNWLLDLLAWAFGSGDPVPPPSPPPAPEQPGEYPVYAVDLLELHNRKRTRTPLTLSRRLSDCAVKYATVMASLRRMGHSVDGTSFVQRARAEGYPNPGAENVAMGYNTVHAVFEGWFGSPGHRANILGPYLEVGFGRAVDSRGRLYWCAVFGWGNQALQATIAENEPLIAPGIKVRRVQRFIKTALPHGKMVEVWEEVPG